MAIKQTRKTPQQIKEEILSSLNEEPLSIEQLRIKLNSNWSTTNNYLQELSKEKKVKEIISANKTKIYQRIFGDTYFNLPLDQELKKKFKTLFYLILQVYKKNSQVPTKTQLSKCAVEVIKNKNSELDLPVIWYLYGLIPLMVADPSENYSEEISFKKKSNIIQIIESYRDKNHIKSSRQIDKEQHKEYEEEEKLYVLADQFSSLIDENKFEEAIKILNKFYIACPIDESFPEVFDFTDRFFSTLNKLSKFENLENYRREIVSTFDSLWKYITTYKVYQSLSKLNIISDKKILFDFYISDILELRKNCFQESFSELYSIYLSNLKEKEIKLSNESKNVRDILEGWTIEKNE